MIGRGRIDVEITAENLQRFAAVLRSEEDGKQLRRELARNMREALKPAAAQAKSGIMAMPSAGSGTGPGLRAGIARKIRPEVKLGGMWTGARIKAKKTPNLRGFTNAPKRTQRRAGGWRTLTWGHEPWRTQHGKPKWFDRAMEGVGPEGRQAVVAAMAAMARRIADRTR